MRSTPIVTSAPGDERTDDPNPLDLFLDLSVYAPLGFALEFRRLVPELAEAGRKQVDFSRSLGRAALRTLSRAGATTTPSKKPPRPASRPDPPPEQPADAAADESTAATARVDGYDELTAKAVIALVADAPVSQLAWMRDREAATKSRKTVLAAIDRLLDDRR